MSAPKLNRKTTQPKRQRIHPHTEARRKNILRILQDSPGMPVTDLRERIGVDEYAVYRAINWLREEGYNIHSMAKGYILIDNSAAEIMIMRRLEMIETMLVQLMNGIENKQSLPPSVQEPCKPRMKAKTLGKTKCIIELFQSGMSQANIARELKLNRSTVSRALKKIAV